VARLRLTAITEQFQADGNLPKLLTAVLMAAIEATGADFGNIQIVEIADGGLRIVAQHGFGHEFLNFFRYVKEDKSACSAALQACRRTVVEDVRQSRVYTEPARQAMLSANALACQSTPIVGSTGRIVGVISTHFRVPQRPTRGQLALVDTFANGVADIIERSLPRWAALDLARAAGVDAERDASVTPDALLNAIQRLFERSEPSQKSAAPQTANDRRRKSQAKARLRGQPTTQSVRRRD
jgi:GAF domain-containing protein